MTRKTFQVIDTWLDNAPVSRVYGPNSKALATRYAQELAWKHSSVVSAKGRFVVTELTA